MAFVKLFVRTAGEDPSSQISVDCPREETVALLKLIIQVSHRAQPSPAQQKLIYAGSVLRDEQRIQDIFPLHFQEGPFTVHLVISSIEQAQPQTSAETPYPEPAQPYTPEPSMGYGQPQAFDPAMAEAYQQYVNYMLYWSSMGVTLGYTFPQFVESILPTLRAQTQNQVPARPLAPEQQQQAGGFNQNFPQGHNPGVGQDQQAPFQPRAEVRQINVDVGQYFNIMLKCFVAYMLLSNHADAKRWAIIIFIGVIWALFKYGYIRTTYQSRRYYHIRQQIAERLAAERANTEGPNPDQQEQEQERPQPIVRLSVAQELECLLLPLVFSLFPGWEEGQEQPRQEQPNAANPNPNPNLNQ